MKVLKARELERFDSCTGAAESSRDTLTLEKLVTTIHKLGLDRPRPLAIWFVDRPAEHLQLISHYDFTAEVQQVHLFKGYLSLHGLPIRQFTTDTATEEELATYHFFCTLPGIWIEMSDGNHVLLGETK